MDKQEIMKDLYDLKAQFNKTADELEDMENLRLHSEAILNSTALQENLEAIDVDEKTKEFLSKTKELLQK